MKNPYRTREDTIYDELSNPHTVYGIEAPDQNISIPDIFTSKPAAEDFVSLCNCLELSPIHISEVLEDIL